MKDEKEDGIGPVVGSILVLTAIVVSFSLPGWIADLIGLGPTLSEAFLWWQEQDRTTKILVALLYRLTGFFILVAVVAAVGTAISCIISDINNAANRLADSVSRVVRSCFEFKRNAVRLFLWLLFWPVRTLSEFTWDFVSERISYPFELWHQQLEIRRLYRTEFATEFRSFREFKRYWDAVANGQEPPEHDTQGTNDHRTDEQGTNGRQEEPPRSDPLAAAIRLLGLFEGFTKADLEQRYKALMKGVHPDIAGPNDLARQLNEARTLIKERMAWT